MSFDNWNKFIDEYAKGSIEKSIGSSTPPNTNETTEEIEQWQNTKSINSSPIPLKK